MRWLTGQNIRFFLDVVSHVETSHMWAPRRKFWLGLYEQRRIDAAWVAFSRKAAEFAAARLSEPSTWQGIGFLVAHLLLIVLGLWAWDALLEDRTEAGLQAEMRGAAANLDFERAATLRDELKVLKAQEMGLDAPTSGPQA